MRTGQPWRFLEGCIEYEDVHKQAREEGGQGSANAGKWFCFDDNQVEPWDLANLDRDCFGGKYTVDLSDTNPQVGVKVRRWTP